MKNLLLTLILMLFMLATGYSQNGNSNTKATQTSVDPSTEEEVFTVCEEPPTFPGGEKGLNDFIRTNLHYSDSTLKNRADDKVFITFIVTQAGTVRDITLLKGINPEADKEAVRLVQSMPAWKPGRQSGRPVNVKLSLALPLRPNNVK